MFKKKNKKTNCAQISRKIKTTEFIFTWQEIIDKFFFFFFFGIMCITVHKYFFYFLCFLKEILRRGLLKRIINILRTLL